MRTNIIVTIIAAIAICIFVYYHSRYVISDDEQVVITQFGKVVGEKAVPGEYFIIPVVQKIHYFTKKFFLTEWKAEIPTKEKKFLSLKIKAFWQISDPIEYYKTLNSDNLAKNFIMDQVGIVVRNFIVSHTITELVGKDDVIELKDAEYDYRVAFSLIEIAKPPIAKSGISLSNIEARVTYPIETSKP